MTADEWTEAFAREIGLSPPDRERVGAILKLAGTAAHSSERNGRARRGVARRGKWQADR
jgi:hypothetical protein